jgi:DNA-binding transcriptional LysR family regulator
MAARALRVAPSAVTKRLAALEARLGLRLFQRTTRRVSPTAEGATRSARAAITRLPCWRTARTSSRSGRSNCFPFGINKLTDYCLNEG